MILKDLKDVVYWPMDDVGQKPMVIKILNRLIEENEKEIKAADLIASKKNMGTVQTNNKK